jgi:hypothetical protein
LRNEIAHSDEYTAPMLRFDDAGEHAESPISLAFSSDGALVVETFMPGFGEFEAGFIGVSACLAAWS